jgi:hypothetical protein
MELFRQLVQRLVLGLLSLKRKRMTSVKRRGLSLDDGCNSRHREVLQETEKFRLRGDCKSILGDLSELRHLVVPILRYPKM